MLKKKTWLGERGWYEIVDTFAREKPRLGWKFGHTLIHWRAFVLVWREQLLLSESESLFHGNRELLFQLLIRLVRWQVNSVKASVTLGKLSDFSGFFNRESSRAI